jgi:hypothetical protein
MGLVKSAHEALYAAKETGRNRAGNAQMLRRIFWPRRRTLRCYASCRIGMVRTVTKESCTAGARNAQ